MIYITTMILLSTLFSPRYLSASESIVIEQDLYKKPIGKYMDILEDKNRKWTIDDVVSGSMSDLFIPSTVDSPAFGFTLSAYWVRFTVVNSLSKEVSWLLEVAYPPMDHIQVYIPVSSESFDIKYAGDSLPFNAREMQHRNFVFHMQEAPHSQTTYYIRFETEGAINLPLFMYSYETLAENIDKE
jgi:two-component system, sensor histidine kinase LadS